MNMEERLQAVVSQAETDSIKWHNIIHGLDTETVATENGNVPTVAKQMKDVHDEVVNGVVDYLGSCETAKDIALQAKDDTLTIKDETDSIKSQTLTLKNEAENFKNLSQSTFNSIESAVLGGVSTIQTEGESQRSLISSAGTIQVQAVNTEGATQVALATAQAQLALIAATDVTSRSLSVYQDMSSISNTTVVLEDNVSIYNKSINTSITLNFDISHLTKNNKVITFELMLRLLVGGGIAFSNTISWLNEETPELTEVKNYLLVFRSFDNGSTWIGNLQGSW